MPSACRIRLEARPGATLGSFSAGHASATAEAPAASLSLKPSAGHASATGAAYGVAGKPSASAGHASATGIGRNATVSTTAATISGVYAVQVSATSMLVTWTVSEGAQGWVEYGATSSYGSETTHETSYTYSIHAQTITGLTAGQTYHFRPRGVVSSGATVVGDDATFTVAVFTDYDLTGVTSYGGNTIDATGAVDSTAGLNAWIAAQPNGTSAAARARYIFPSTATYRITTGLCLDTKSYVTLWGHTASSSAWLPDRTKPGGTTHTYGSVPTPGCTISNACTSGAAPSHSAFIVGSGYLGASSISFAKTCTDVVIRGFNIDGNATTPGIFNSSFEVCNAFEVGRAVGVEIMYNKAIEIPGDFVRYRGDATVCDSVIVHHNWGVAMGRQGASFVEGDGLYFDDNVMERCGYYGLDLEPDDDSTLAYRVIDNVYARRNTFGSFGSTSVAGTFAAIGCGTHTHVADVTITDNAVTGSTYGTYATGSQDRSLTTYVGQHIANTGAAGSDPHIQRLTFSGNAVTHANTIAGPVFHAGGVDTLVVTGNDTNLASGSFASLGPHDSLYFYTPTSVTNTGNT